MIKLNDEKVMIGNFPDGTTLMKMEVPKTDYARISWYYEEEKELITLIYLVNHLKAHGHNNITLYMPYIPNARMDRVKEEEDVFTLKYFASVINFLGFKQVTVRDPHSSVSEALIDNIYIIQSDHLIKSAIKSIQYAEGETPNIFYPDEGAMKRYSEMVPLPYTFGIKKRDWKDGTILGLDVAGDVDNIRDKNILIVDDICSKGGTFYHAAKKLKELGAKNIYLFVTHCENTIFEGELLKSNLIKMIYTTNSILTKCHKRIFISGV